MYVNHSNNTKRFADDSIALTETVAIDFVDSQESDELLTTDNLRIFMNEIDMLFEIEAIDKALFHRMSDGAVYQTFIEQKLQQESLTARYFNYTIDVKVMQGERKDIMLVTIEILQRYDKTENFSPVTKQFII